MCSTGPVGTDQCCKTLFWRAGLNPCCEEHLAQQAGRAVPAWLSDCFELCVGAATVGSRGAMCHRWTSAAWCAVPLCIPAASSLPVLEWCDQGISGLFTSQNYSPACLYLPDSMQGEENWGWCFVSLAYESLVKGTSLLLICYSTHERFSPQRLHLLACCCRLFHSGDIGWLNCFLKQRVLNVE